MDEWMNGWMEVRVGGWVCVCGWFDGWMDGWTDGCSYQSYIMGFSFVISFVLFNPTMQKITPQEKRNE
jgi:hypothetical protein